MICIDLKDSNYGSPSANGTYDGMIGQVQANITNTVMAMFPYDSIPFEPGVFVPAPMPAFLPHIYSGKISGKNNSGLDILYLYSNFTVPEWMYLLVTLTLSVILALFIRWFYHRESRQKVRKIVLKFFGYWWDIIMLMVDMAPSEISRARPISVLWTFIVIAAYYGIHIIFMSTLSADLTTNGPDKVPNNLEDLLHDPTFDKFRPTICTQLNMLNVLSKSRNGTILRELLDRAYQADSVVSADINNPQAGLQEVMGVFEEVHHLTRAVVEDSVMLDIIASQMACHIQPQVMEGIVKSRSPIYQAPMAMLLSHDTHPDIVRLYDYRSRTGIEFGIIKGGVHAQDR